MVRLRHVVFITKVLVVTDHSSSIWPIIMGGRVCGIVHIVWLVFSGFQVSLTFSFAAQDVCRRWLKIAFVIVAVVVAAYAAVVVIVAAAALASDTS